MNAEAEGEKRIAGCSFSIHPMSDSFIDLINGALNQVDTTKVWLRTDAVSTIIRGRIPHIFDVSGAVFLQAVQSGEHVAFHATYSIGCPGDSRGHVYMAKDDIPLNASDFDELSRPIAAKFALYPMGGGNYMELINRQIEEMKSREVDVTPTHYETRLDGEASVMFQGLQEIFTRTDHAGSSHTIMTVSMAANVPEGTV